MTQPIYCPVAYQAGINAAINRNASKTRLKTWLAAGEDHQEIYEWLSSTGRYAPIDDTTNHPVSWHNGPDGSFKDMLNNIAGSLTNSVRFEGQWWGNLSPKQTDVARKALARNKDWAANATARKKVWQDQAAKRNYVGTVGDKKFSVDATVSFIKSFETEWGLTWLTIMRDENDNTIKYMGNKFLARKGQTIQMIATIKSHETYKGEKQTIVQRPRNIRTSAMEAA